MICPICKKGETSVVDSRPTEDGTTIRRRRLCICGERFTTFERIQFRELMVVKKNGRKSPFDRDKLSKSIYIALKKRPIDTDTVEKFITNISRALEEIGQNEISSNAIGKMVMDGLKNLDPVATGSKFFKTSITIFQIALDEISFCPNSSSDLEILVINFSTVSVSIGLVLRAM